MQRFHEHIPLRFDSIERYVSILEPLLIEEFRASVKESFIEPSGMAHFAPLALSFSQTIISVLGHYIDATCKQMRVVESGKVNAFYFVTLGRAQHDMRADDLVLLSRTPVRIVAKYFSYCNYANIKYRLTGWKISPHQCIYSER